MSLYIPLLPLLENQSSSVNARIRFGQGRVLQAGLLTLDSPVLQGSVLHHAVL